MKEIRKIFIGLLGFMLLSGIAYATITIANTNISSYLPWQGTESGTYDSAHNVGTSNMAQSRFSFVSGTTVGGTSTVLDNITGITWQSNGTDSGIMDLASAKNYCETLGLGGESDWKIPNRVELSSLLDFSKTYPSIDTTFFTDSTTPYWSSTIHDAGYAILAFDVNFYSPGSYRRNIGQSIYARCLR